MTRVTALNARDDLRELADRYETVAALEPTPDPHRGGLRAVPGPRVPPGLEPLLDADELSCAITAVSEWAEFLTHVLVDEADATDPGSVTARLRAAADHAGHFTDHPDEFLAIAVRDDLRHHLKVMRRLAARGTSYVRTGMSCQDPTCPGHYVCPLGSDDALECSRCRHRVPYVVWSAWPRTRITYVTVEHAARIAGTTVAGVKMRASRGGWRKVGTGRDVRYHVDDVRGVSEQSA